MSITRISLHKDCQILPRQYIWQSLPVREICNKHRAAPLNSHAKVVYISDKKVSSLLVWIIMNKLTEKHTETQLHGVPTCPQSWSVLIYHTFTTICN